MIRHQPMHIYLQTRGQLVRQLNTAVILINIMVLRDFISNKLKILYHNGLLTTVGVSHGDEQIYLVLYRNGIAPTTLPTKEEVQMRKAMIQLVVDFARTG